MPAVTKDQQGLHVSIARMISLQKVEQVSGAYHRQIDRDRHTCQKAEYDAHPISSGICKLLCDALQRMRFDENFQIRGCRAMTVLALLGSQAHLNVLEECNAIRLASDCLSIFPENMIAAKAAIAAITVLCEALPRGK